jgi:hypothetical protein
MSKLNALRYCLLALGRVPSTCTLLYVSNWPPRYLSEFLCGGPVAGPVIYYLFEILYFSTKFSTKYSMGQFAGPVIFYLLEVLTTGQFAGLLSNIFRILGASSRSGELLKHSRVFPPAHYAGARNIYGSNPI